MQKSKNSKSSQAIFILFVLFQSFTYGIGNPLTKVAYESITPFWLLATRFLLSFLIVVPLFGKKIWAQVKSVHWSVWLPSCLCCASAYISSNVALDLATATTVGFLMSLPVLFVPFLTVLVLRRPYDYKRLPVQALMIIGLFFFAVMAVPSPLG